jgi:hypothetical protein
MRFMMMLKNDPRAEMGLQPDSRVAAALTRFGDELARAGVLLSAQTLRTSARGARVTFARGKRRITHGPFTRERALVAAFWLIEVGSRQQAIDWACRCPGANGELAMGDGSFELEVRELAEASDGFSDMDEAEAELRRYMFTGS